MEARCFILGMIGVAINAVGIIAGAVVGLKRKQRLTVANESFFKVAMGAATVFLGLQLTWQSLYGTSIGIVSKHLAIVLISMTLGKLTGQLLRLQKISNSIGRYATSKMSLANTAAGKSSDGFFVAALLACASPLGIFASVQEGLSATNFAPIFVVKAVMDGLAAMTFVSVFGWGVMLAAIPVVAFQGTIFLLVKSLSPTLADQSLADSILATNGLLIFCVALIILNLKKVELADYIPSLAIAPLITWLLQ